MTEIQKLEAEINEKKMLLKHLKSLENPRLKFDALLDSLRTVSECRLFIAEIVDSLRGLALSVASAKLRVRSPEDKSIHSYPRIRRIKDLSPETIHILNDMIAEIGPIVAKYTWRFATKQTNY